MALTLSRGMSRHHEPDFEQRYADLNEGYENYAKYVEERAGEIAASEEYTPEQKQQLLNVYKQDLMEQQENYRAEYQNIAEEEAQYRAEQEGYSDYGYGDYSCYGEEAAAESGNDYAVEQEFSGAETAVEEASQETGTGYEV